MIELRTSTSSVACDISPSALLLSDSISSSVVAGTTGPLSCPDAKSMRVSSVGTISARRGTSLGASSAATGRDVYWDREWVIHGVRGPEFLVKQTQRAE